MIFLIINWQNFMYLLLDPDLYPSPFKFIRSITLHLPIGWTPVTDTTDKQTNGRVFVNLCLRRSLTLTLQHFCSVYFPYSISLTATNLPHLIAKLNNMDVWMVYIWVAKNCDRALCAWDLGVWNYLPTDLKHCRQPSICGCWPSGMELPATRGHVGTISDNLPHSTQDVSVHWVISWHLAHLTFCLHTVYSGPSSVLNI